jgi:transposase
LGVIIQAFQYLRKLGIPAPRLCAQAAERLGLSRKSGYRSARVIREMIERPQTAAPDGDSQREIARLRIQVQVLCFERDHPEVRFSQRRSHLPEEARSLCVRLMRDFRPELSESEIALCIGVPLSSLKRWEEEADPECRFPEKPDRRGQHRRATAEDVQRVLETFQQLDRSMALEEFTAHFNSLHPSDALDRKTITRILQGHGELKIETQNEEKPYRSPFEVYFPGAQIAVDGTECEVVFSLVPPI